MGQLPVCSQLLLQLGIFHEVPTCFTRSFHQFWRVVTTTDLGNRTQGHGFPDRHVINISGMHPFRRLASGLKGRVVVVVGGGCQMTGHQCP